MVNLVIMPFSQWTLCKKQGFAGSEIWNNLGIILKTVSTLIMALLFASSLTDLGSQTTPQIHTAETIFENKKESVFTGFVWEASWSRPGRDLRPKTISNHMFTDSPLNLDRCSHMLVELGCIFKSIPRKTFFEKRFFNKHITRLSKDWWMTGGVTPWRK